MQTKYSKFIEKIIDGYTHNDYIESKNIALLLSTEFQIDYAHSRKRVATHLKRLSDKNKIKRITKGVYVKPFDGLFGRAYKTLTHFLEKSLLIDSKEQRIGYVSGEDFRRSIGIIDLVASKREITSNKYKTKIDNNENIFLYKPVILITEKNYRYLQFIDAVRDIAKGCFVNCDNTNILLKKHISNFNLDEAKLIEYTKKYYDEKTLDYIKTIVF